MIWIVGYELQGRPEIPLLAYGPRPIDLAALLRLIMASAFTEIPIITVDLGQIH